MAQDKFDLEMVERCFTKCLIEDEDIQMDDYLEGFKELFKFFQMMGSVFGFVSSDVYSKVDILEDYRTKESSEKFITFKTMLEYEKTTGLLIKSDYVSGSRTLLRLHRGLDFIREFLRQLGNLKPNDKTSSTCRSAYDDTLAKFHPWIIRKSATVAMYALPNRDQLLKKVCQDAEKAVEVLPTMLNATKMVYDRTESMYTDFDLHGLP